MTTVAMTVGEIGMTDNFFSITHDQQIVSPMETACSNPYNVTVSTGGSVTSDLLSRGYTWFFLLIFIVISPIILMNLLVGTISPFKNVFIIIAIYFTRITK